MTTKPARSWLRITRLCSTSVAKSSARGDRVRRRHQARHQLDEAQHRHRVEEVDADHLLGPLVAMPSFMIGIELVLLARIACRRRRPCRAPEHLDLERLVLDHRLDDELTVGELAEVGRERDPRDGRVALVLGELAGRTARSSDLARRPLAGLRGAGVDLGDDDVEPGSGAHLGDARAQS